MKVVILAGGFGSRLSEHTNKIPKPMVKIGNKPIIEHIMHIYMKYGYNEFIFALGYKKEKFKKYFKNKNYNIKFVDTGLTTMTGGRLKRLKKYLNEETFMMTYGDGLANVNIKKLVSFHNRKKKTVTITAVRPPARFGHLNIRDSIIFLKSKKNNIFEPKCLFYPALNKFYYEFNKTT
jgi:glucose-1-phosphate cytidylyltransferase